MLRILDVDETELGPEAKEKLRVARELQRKAIMDGSTTEAT